MGLYISTLVNHRYGNLEVEGSYPALENLSLFTPKVYAYTSSVSLV